MGYVKDDFLNEIVDGLKAKGLNVIHADSQANHGRMITIVVDEGDPDKVTLFEIWPDGFMPDQIADKAAAARADVGPGMVFEIGDNPRAEA